MHADPGTPNDPVSPDFRPGLFVVGDVTVCRSVSLEYKTPA